MGTLAAPIVQRLKSAPEIIITIRTAGLSAEREDLAEQAGQRRRGASEIA